jgi:dihydropyrimidinase
MSDTQVSRTLVRGGTVVTADAMRQADVLIEQGTIVQVEPGIQTGHATIIDASGKLVIPGGIDAHTHLEAPVSGMESSDDFETGTRAAAFGGTTCIIDFATPDPGESLVSTLDRWIEKGEKSCIDYGLHMVVTDARTLGEIPNLIEKGVSSFKVFMAYPGSLMLDDASIFGVMEQCAGHGGVVCVHAENGTLINMLVSRELERGNRTPIYHARSRPPITESEAIHRAISIALLARCPLYVVHVSTSGGLEEILRAKKTEQQVFAETCPHYLYLTEEELERPHFEGARYVLTPPLRERSHGVRLRAGLVEGAIDVVATDHCPFMFRGQKDRGRDDFTRIPNGGPGIEHRLQLLFHDEVCSGRITPQRWVNLVATAPAKIFGLFPRKGTIAVGSDADLVVWNAATRHTISETTHHMRVDYSMYEGRDVQGAADIVMSRGEVIVENGVWKGRRGHGAFLPRATYAPVPS